MVIIIIIWQTNLQDIQKMENNNNRLNPLYSEEKTTMLSLTSLYCPLCFPFKNHVYNSHATYNIFLSHFAPTQLSIYYIKKMNIMRENAFPFGNLFPNWHVLPRHIGDPELELT